jgi:hypothetical protein
MRGGCKPGTGIRVGEGTPGTGKRGLIAGALVDAVGKTGLEGKTGKLGSGAGTAAAGLISAAFVEATFVETFKVGPAGWPNARLSNSAWFAFVDWAGKGANAAPSAASALLKFGPRKPATAGICASAPRHVKRRARKVFTLF